MSTYFISDLHLDDNYPNGIKLFEHFLSHFAAKADALYILGDLFESWIGDDENLPWQNQIIQALKQLREHQVPCYFMAGNRDFLVGQAFAKAAGCQIIPDPSVIKLYGEEILLLHGDSLCTQDVGHQRYRVWTQKNWLKKLFLMLPLWFRKNIANRIRERSQLRGKRLHQHIMDIDKDTLKDVLNHHAVNQVIHGHTHRPTQETFTVGAKTCVRIVLSDWGDRGNYLVCQPNGEKNLEYFTL